MAETMNFIVTYGLPRHSIFQCLEFALQTKNRHTAVFCVTEPGKTQEIDLHIQVLGVAYADEEGFLLIKGRDRRNKWDVSIRYNPERRCGTLRIHI